MVAPEGGLTFQKGLGAVHAFSHPLGECAMGVREEAITTIADAAARDHRSETNPRPATAEDCAR